MGKSFSPFHSDMLQFIVDAWLGRMPEGMRRGVMVSPRSFAKSTCGKIACLYVMTEAVRAGFYKPRMGQDYDMIYVTGKEDLAKQAMRPIWYELRNNKYILQSYGQLIKSDRDIKEELDAQLTNGFRIMAGGIGGRWLGNHPAMLFLDDIEDKKTINSEDARARLRREYFEEIDPMMLPGRYQLLLGNYLHLFCLLRHVAHLDDSHLMKRSALEPNEDGNLVSVWPEMYTTKYLQDYQKAKPNEFSTLFMNNPVIDADSPIKLSHIRDYDPDEMGLKFWGNWAVVTMTDPAARQKKKNCESAMVTVAWDNRLSRPDIYVLDVRVGHWSADDILNQNKAVYSYYHSSFLGIEDVSFQDLFVKMSQMSQVQEMSLPLVGLNPLDHGLTKRFRLDKAATWTKQGRVYFNRKDAATQRLIDQLVSYQEGDKFDIGDAYCMAINQLATIFPPLSSGSDRSFEPEYVRNPVTGRIIGYK